MSSVYDVAIRIAAETKDLVKEIKSNTGLLQTMGTVAAGIFAAGMIRDAATELYAYGTGIDTIREKVGLLSGVQGDALNKITGAVKATSDIWNKDYNEVIKASNVLTKQLGADSDKAMKLIQQGMASGGDATGDFLQQVSEYAPMFKDAKLSAEALVAVVTQGVTSGIFSDKGPDAIKESMLRIREMTTATEDALAGIGISSDEVQKKLQNGTWTYLDVLKLVSKKLGEFPPQSKQVGTAIADIFGGAGEDAGLDYLKTLKNIELDMDKVVASGGALTQQQLDQAEASEKLNAEMAALFGGLNEQIRDVKATATQLAVGVVQNFNEITNVVKVGVAGLAGYKLATVAANFSMMDYKRTIVLARKAMQVFNITAKANPIGLVVGLLSAAGAAYLVYKNNAEEAVKAKMKFNSEVSSSTTTLNSLFGVLKNTKKGTEAYTEAINTINSKYSEYLPNLLTEKNTLEEIEQAQKAANDALVRKIALKAKEAEIEEVTSKYLEANKKINDEIISQISRTKGSEIAGIAAKELQDLVKTSSQIGVDYEKYAERGKLVQAFADKYGFAMGDVSRSTFAAAYALNKQEQAIKEIDGFYKGFIGTLDKTATEQEQSSGKANTNLAQQTGWYQEIDKEIKQIQKEIDGVGKGDTDRLTILQAQLVNLENQKKELKKLGDIPVEMPMLTLDLEVEDIDFDESDLQIVDDKAALVLANYNKELKQAAQYNALLGDSNSLLRNEIDLTKQAIGDLVDAGYSAQSEEIKVLMSDLAQLQTQYKGSSAGFMQWVGNMQQGVSTMQQGVSNITALGSAFDSLSEKQKNGEAGVLDYVNVILQMASSILGTIEVVDAIGKAVKAKQVIDTAATTAAVTGETTKAGAVVASQATMTAAIVSGQATQATAVTTSSMAQAVALKILGATAMGANAEIGISGAIASASALPFPGNLIAMGAALGISTGLFTTAKGVSASLATPFANGGLVSGPTLGLVGEYPGARSNPEVIAPLDKLKKLIQPNGGVTGEVSFEIHGDVIRGVLNRGNRKQRGFR